MKNEVTAVPEVNAEKNTVHEASTNNLLETALTYIRAGESVIPVGPDKKPLPTSWREFQHRVPTEDEVNRWFSTIPTIEAIALVLRDGQTVVDFDDPAFFDAFIAKSGELVDALPMQKSGKGFHVAFRASKSTGNRKLAWAGTGPDRRIAIETKGEGGYIIVAPSLHGATGKRYEALRSTFAEIPTIPDEQADQIIALARKFDQSKPTTLDFSTVASTKVSAKDAAIIDAYNQKFGIEDLLEKHGYKPYPDGKYLAPNSTSGNPGIKISERDGKRVCISFHGDEIGAEVNPETGNPLQHDAFDLFRILEHGGKFNKALTAADGLLGVSDTLMPTFIVGDLLTMDLPEPEFIVPGIIPEGLTILAGKPKIGKSWLALELCVEVARGGKVLDQQAVQGRAVYFALEDNPRRLKKRLHALLPGETRSPDLLTLADATSIQRLDKGGHEQLENFLRANPDVKLVVIDTLARIKGDTKKRNIYDEDAELMDQLHKLAGRYGIALVVIHHTRKAEAEDTFDMISGSFGLQGIADAMITLTKKHGQRDAVLSVTGRDIEDELELAVHHDKDTTRWQVMGDAQAFQLTAERMAIKSALREAGVALKPSEVADRTGKNRSAAKALMHKMAADGHLERLDGGKYQIPTTPV